MVRQVCRFFVFKSIYRSISNACRISEILVGTKKTSCTSLKEVLQRSSTKPDRRFYSIVPCPDKGMKCECYGLWLDQGRSTCLDLISASNPAEFARRRPILVHLH